MARIATGQRGERKLKEIVGRTVAAFGCVAGLLVVGQATASATVRHVSPRSVVRSLILQCHSYVQHGGWESVVAYAGCELDSTDGVEGGILVKPGGSLILNGGFIGKSVVAEGAQFVNIGGDATIGGSVVIQGATGTTATLICSSTIFGTVWITQNKASSEIVVGGTDDPANSCAGPVSMRRALIVTYNAGLIDVGNNDVSESIFVVGNTGGGDLVDNVSGKRCTLLDNSPAITNTGNSAGISRTCIA